MASRLRLYVRFLACPQDLDATRGAVDPHPHAVSQRGGPVASAGNARESQFAAHDGGVAHGASDVGQNRFGQWKQ